MASLGQKNTEGDHGQSFAEAEGNDIHCGAPHAQPQAVRLARQDLPLENPPGQLPAQVPEMSPKGTLTGGTPLTSGSVCSLWFHEWHVWTLSKMVVTPADPSSRTGDLCL